MAARTLDIEYQADCLTLEMCASPVQSSHYKSAKPARPYPEGTKHMTGWSLLNHQVQLQATICSKIATSKPCRTCLPGKPDGQCLVHLQAMSGWWPQSNTQIGHNGHAGAQFKSSHSRGRELGLAPTWPSVGGRGYGSVWPAPCVGEGVYPGPNLDMCWGEQL